jgi:hypothetical protein
MEKNIKRHKPTGTIVWFPNSSSLGIVVKASHPWKLWQVYTFWNDMEDVEMDIEFKLTDKQK